MEKRYIKGMAGKARQGKDTVGKILAGYLGYETYALAEPIKVFVNALCGWGPYQEYDDIKETEFPVQVTAKTISAAISAADKYGLREYVHKHRGEFLISEVLDKLNISSGNMYLKTPRELYQLMGTEYGREYVSPNIWIDLMPREGVIVTDIRFPNEADAVRSSGGRVIHITRDNTTVGISGHASEAGVPVDPSDILFDNSGSLDDLYANIDRLLQ